MHSIHGPSHKIKEDLSMDSDTIMEKYPHLTAQAMEATGKSDPQEAIEALLAAQEAEDTPHTEATVEAAYSRLNAHNRAVVKELIEYIIDNWQNGEGATA